MDLRLFLKLQTHHLRVVFAHIWFLSASNRVVVLHNAKSLHCLVLIVQHGLLQRLLSAQRAQLSFRLHEVAILAHLLLKGLIRREVTRPEMVRAALHIIGPEIICLRGPLETQLFGVPIHAVKVACNS